MLQHGHNKTSIFVNALINPSAATHKSGNRTAHVEAYSMKMENNEANTALGPKPSKFI
jgi:hypothetical protein